MFKPTYLYIKTHNKTKLKYFGKTVRDPYTYSGSGTYWLRHLKKYGNDVTTEIIGIYTNETEFKEAALNFSLKHNIVESKEWANIRPESGDGGDTSLSENYQKWLPNLSIENKKRRWWNNGQHQIFKEFPPDQTYIRGRLYFNNVGAKIGNDIQKDKRWVNNGKIEMMLSLYDTIPENYKPGRLLTTAFGGTGRHSAKGTKWWNNGENQVMSKDCPGRNWTQGRIKGGGYGTR